MQRAYNHMHIVPGSRTHLPREVQYCISQRCSRHKVGPITRMELEDEENRRQSVDNRNSIRCCSQPSPIRACARRVRTLQIEMCGLPWCGRNWFVDGKENGRTRLHQ